MSRSKDQGSKNGRVVIRGVRRRQPDISKISRAVIGLALYEAALEAEAQRAAAARDESPRPSLEPGTEGEPRD